MTLINLYRGHPSDSLLPSAQVAEAVAEVLDPSRIAELQLHEESRHPLTYGTDPGALWVRQCIADWSARCHGESRIDPNWINLTCGASYGAMNILAQTTLPHNGYTRQAFVVSPTYFLMNSVLIDAGFAGKMTAIEEKEDGELDLQFLQQKLEYFDAQPIIDDVSIVSEPSRSRKLFRYVLYCVPDFSNPRGGTLPISTRKRLIELARKHDMLILCDDVYDLLDYTRLCQSDDTKMPKLPKLVTLDRETGPSLTGNVVSNASFSKLLGPGLRVGWQECVSEVLASQLATGGANKSGGVPSQFSSMVVAQLIVSGRLDEIVANFKRVYAARAEAAMAALKAQLPAGTRIEGGKGGYFLWVTMPKQINVPEMCRLCEQRGVLLAPGSDFEVTNDIRGWGETSVRICIAYLETERQVEGIKIWGEVCKEMLRGGVRE